MDYEKYKNEVPYPERPKKPVLTKGASPEEVREYADKLEAYNKGMVEYQTQWRLAQKGEADAVERFKIDLFKELDISNHPKREELFSLAWEYGHSFGFSEVYGHATDFVVLLSK